MAGGAHRAHARDRAAGSGVRAAGRGGRLAGGRAAAQRSGGHQALHPVADPAGGAQARRSGAGVVGHLAGRRRHRAAGDQLGLGRAAAAAHRKVGRADAAARAVGQEVLDAPVLERVERDRGQAPAVLVQDRPGLGQRPLQIVQLVVDHDADGLKYALCRGTSSKSAPHGGRQSGLDGGHEVGRGLQRGLLAAADDLAGDDARVAILAVGADDLGQLALLHRVDHGARVQLLARVHAHVQRRVVGVGEAALARVDLHRRDAEVEVDDVGGEALLAQQRQRLGVVHAQEAGMAGHLGGQLLEALLGVGVAVDAHQRARRADPLGHQPRVAAGAERAVDHAVALTGPRQVDQLAGEYRYVRARHVKKDRQGSPSPPP